MAHLCLIAAAAREMDLSLDKLSSNFQIDASHGRPTRTRESRDASEGRSHATRTTLLRSTRASTRKAVPTPPTRATRTGQATHTTAGA